MENIFTGTPGNWKPKEIGFEKIPGATTTKIVTVPGNKIIGRIYATHKKQSKANVRLITNAVELLNRSNDLLSELTKLDSKETNSMEDYWRKKRALQKTIEQITEN